MKKPVCFLLILCFILFPAAQAEEAAPQERVIPAAYGDLDADGQITVRDALLTLQGAVQTRCLSIRQQDAAEVSGDGSVNAADALCILQNSVGKKAGFPAAAALADTDLTLGTVNADRYGNSSPEGAVRLAKLQQLQAAYRTSTHINEVAQTADELAPQMAAGTLSCDLLEVDLATARQLYKQKALKNLAGYPLHTAVTNHPLTRALTVGEHRFGAGVDTSCVSAPVVYYNRSLWERYVPDYDPDTLYRQNNWTFDTFRQIAIESTVDTNGNGKKDIYGFTADDTFIQASCGAGAQGLAVMENGRVTATVGSAEMTRTLKWCKTLFKNDRSWKYQADRNNCIQSFANGETMMLVSSLSDLDTVMQKAPFAVGLLPLPAGNSQSAAVNTAYGGYVYVVPAGSGKTDAACVWINEMSAADETLLTVKEQSLTGWGLSAQDALPIIRYLQTTLPEYSAGVVSQTVITELNGFVTTESKYMPEAELMAYLSSVVQEELDAFYGECYDPPLLRE